MNENKFDFDTSNLTSREVAIFEYIVGLLIQSAYIKVGRQARRTIPPLLALLRDIALHHAREFESLRDKEVRFTGNLKAPDGTTLDLPEFKFPHEWQSIYETSAARLLGQRYLEQSRSAKKSAIGNRRKRDQWAERIAVLAPQMTRQHDPGETLGAYVDRVHEYILEQADRGSYDRPDGRLGKPPSRKMVAKHLRELGYMRGSYPTEG